jgi:hypothetical protein
MAVSTYYQESVALGAQFQQQNKSWDGKDTFSYHRQIRDVAYHYNCKTVLDYGCGKGHQWTETTTFWPDATLVKFVDYLNVNSVFQYDPCVTKFATEPPDQKYDLVICTQVLPSIPDDDLEWVKQRLMNLAGRACFIGMHARPPKAKKQIYNKQYFSVDRSQDWYKEFFSNWQGSNLHWWFRDRPYFQDWMSNEPNR